MTTTKRFIALLMSLALLLGLYANISAADSVFAIDIGTVPIVGENFIIDTDGKAWVWGNINGSESMKKLTGSYRDICHSGTVTYTVSENGDLYMLSTESDEPRYMLDSSGTATVNINSTRQKIMSGVSKIVTDEEMSLFVLKTNGELWVIPSTAGRNYRAMTSVTDIITASENAVIALSSDGKVYRCTDLPYVGRASVELVASEVKTLCSTDSDKLIYINVGNELVSDGTVLATDISDADVSGDYLFTVSLDGTLSCTESGSLPIPLSNEAFVSVTASDSDLGCIAAADDGSVWAWESCIPYSFYYYGDELVKIFDNGSPVTTAFQNPISFNINLTANIFEDSVTLSMLPIEGAVGYLINGSREFAVGTELNGTLNFTLPTSDKYTVLAVNSDGYAFARAEKEYTTLETVSSALTITRENLFQQNVVLGDIIDEHITITADRKVSAGYRVYNGNTVIYNSGYIWSGKTIDIDGITYTPTNSGVYTFEIYSATVNEQKSVTFNVGFLSAPYNNSTFIKVDEAHGTYEICHMYSETVSGKPRNVYLYSDRGELDSFYAVNADGSETFIGVGSAIITANSGITRFKVKSNITGVSVISFGYGDRFISYMSGNTFVSYENAKPIYSIFANSSTTIASTVSVNSLSDVIANAKYFISLAEGNVLTTAETELAVKVINIVTIYGGDKLSDELLTALDKLLAKISGVKYSVFYEYESMTVSEIVPQNVTADGLILACNKANVVYLNSLFLRFSQMKTPDNSVLEFKLALRNNGTEVSMTSPVIVTMKMPSGYIHKDNYKLKLTGADGTASWIDYAYNNVENTITFRMNSFGTFNIQPYNGTINNNDYENILSWFTQNQKTVAFVDYDGKIISVQSVFVGKSATAPTTPVRDGYTFTEWDKTFDNIKDNLIVTAVYEKDKTEPVIEPDKPTIDINTVKSTFTDMQNH